MLHAGASGTQGNAQGVQYNYTLCSHTDFTTEVMLYCLSTPIHVWRMLLEIWQGFDSFGFHLINPPKYSTISAHA